MNTSSEELRGLNDLAKVDPSRRQRVIKQLSDGEIPGPSVMTKNSACTSSPPRIDIAHKGVNVRSRNSDHVELVLLLQSLVTWLPSHVLCRAPEGWTEGLAGFRPGVFAVSARTTESPLRHWITTEPRSYCLITCGIRKLVKRLCNHVRGEVSGLHFLDQID